MNSSITDVCSNIPSGESATNLFLTLINTLFAAKCSLDLKNNYPEDYGPHIVDGDQFDFIVIGGGTAGSVVGNILSENENWKVLILEAGKIPTVTSEILPLWPTLQKTSEDWQYITEPNNKSLLYYAGHRVTWPRGKALGGTSSINGALYLRGQPEDYDKWARLGNIGWDYRSILPHFLKLENMTSAGLKANYGKGGFLKLSYSEPKTPASKAIFEAVRELGHPVLDKEGLGFFQPVVANFDGLRQNAGKAFLGSVQALRSNLLVSYESFVERIIIENQIATGVSVNIKGQKFTLRAKKEVILSGGVVKSPHLLLLSGIGPKKLLRGLGIKSVRDLPVGHNLHDHMVTRGVFVKLKNYPNIVTSAVDPIYNYFMHRTGALAENPELINGFIKSSNSSIRNLQFFFALQPRRSPIFVRAVLKDSGISQDFIDYKVSVNQNFTTLDILPVLVKPKSRGQILLNSTNAYDKPLIKPNYLDSEEDINLLLEGIRFAEKLVKTEAFQELGAELVNIPIKNCEGLQISTNDYWKCSLKNIASTANHQVGTCKMGVDQYSVVDPRLKVYGIKGLRVVDASIMPEVTAANTMAPCLVIGHKGGTMIKEDWEQSG